MIPESLVRRWRLHPCGSTKSDKGRRPRAGGVDRRGQIPDMVSIHLRSPEVEDRLMPGHWEGDLIKGKNNASAVGTLVERSSGYLMLVKMNDATGTSAVEGFSAALNDSGLRIICIQQQFSDISISTFDGQGRKIQGITRYYYVIRGQLWQRLSRSTTR